MNGLQILTIQHTLAKYCSIFQAENYAVKVALETILDEVQDEYTKIRIFTDSHSLCKALNQFTPKNKIVASIQGTIRSMPENILVEIQ